MTHSELRRHLASALAAFLEAPEAEAECARWFEDGLGLSQRAHSASALAAFLEAPEAEAR